MKKTYKNNSFKVFPGGKPCEESLDTFLEFLEQLKNGADLVVTAKEKRTLLQNDIWHGAAREWARVHAQSGGDVYTGDDEIKLFFKMWADFGKWKIVRSKRGKPMKLFVPKSTANLSYKKMIGQFAIIRAKFIYEYNREMNFLNRAEVREFMGW